MHWLRIHGIAVFTGVWLNSTEMEIGATHHQRTWLGKDFTLFCFIRCYTTWYSYVCSTVDGRASLIKLMAPKTKTKNKTE